MTANSVPVIRDNIEELTEALPEYPKTSYHLQSSEQMPQVEDSSVSLVATSPPYPMVEMWDELGSYSEQHQMIENVMMESYKKLHEGGIMAINIGDATRSTDGSFRYYPNRAQIETAAEDIGFSPLIPIIWKKATNKPNSFMGSGMKPPNAYITNEVEYILIFRKGDPREFHTDREKLIRNASQYTMEQRNKWFSQIWDVKGANQDDGRAQFPFEIPYRLVRMFTVLGDVVVDPFAGTGTTMTVARSLGRSAIGYEVNDELESQISSKLEVVESIPLKNILRNQIRVDRDGVDPDVFVKDPASLIDII